MPVPNFVIFGGVAFVITAAIFLATGGQLAAPTAPHAANVERQVVAGVSDPLAGYRHSDPEFLAAINTARDSLDDFLASPVFYSEAARLRVMVPYAGGHEHIFMTGLVREGDRLEGTLSEQPAKVPGLALGDRYAFTRADVSDWAYSVEGMIHGGFTLRAMLPRLPEAEAAQLRARLAPLD